MYLLMSFLKMKISSESTLFALACLFEYCSNFTVEANTVNTEQTLHSAGSGWVFTVCPGLSVRILRVNTVFF